MASNKEQHYVPVCYLKSWATGLNKPEVFCMSLKSTVVKPFRQQPKSICKSPNFYTLPKSFYSHLGQNATELDIKIIESVLVKTWEDRWPNVLSCLYDKTSLTAQIDNLKGFVVVQSLRTPAAIRQYMSHIDKYTDRKSEPRVSPDLYPALFGGIIMKSIGENLLDKLQCDVWRIDGAPNFITSDNPASYWIVINNHYQLAPAGLPHLPDEYQNHYIILCPIHPKFLVILRPRSSFDSASFNYGSIPLDRVPFYNHLIETAAEKVLVAKTIDDLYWSQLARGIK